MIPFGPYMLRKRLAVGGMAEVFLASPRDRPDEELVVKRLLPHLEQKIEFVQMFTDEARLTRALNHPNIVRLEGHGEADGIHYIAMEYIDGLPLSRLLAQNPDEPLPLQLGLWVVAEACRALAYAHALTDESGASLGIVHRDVSPDNILIARDGTVKLTDFGIARAKTRLVQTRPGHTKGKLGYMSPEQAMGDTIDQRSDVFSLGTVLYEVTTGHRTFPGPGEGQVLQSLIQSSYRPPGQLVQGFPAALSAVIARTLARNANDRYASANALHHSLLALIPDCHWPTTELAELVRQHAPLDATETATNGPITKREKTRKPSMSDGAADTLPESALKTKVSDEPAALAALTKGTLDTAPLQTVTPPEPKRRRSAPTNETAAYASTGGDQVTYIPPGEEGACEDQDTTFYVAQDISDVPFEQQVSAQAIEAASGEHEELPPPPSSWIGWVVVALVTLTGIVLGLVLFFRSAE